ncbi:MAG: HlyD family efflux transporter periplasmic adaptor subunit [Dethiobacter sp.]|nr:HlyD family efflux transporter periplasmic adaptor subunit [Dethiobacter sp.]
MKKKVRWVLAIVCLLAAGAYYAREAAKPLPVEVLLLEPRTLSVSFSEEGRVVPVQERTLFAAAAGRVSLVKVSTGDTAVKGELLVQLDTSELSYQLASLRGQLESLKGQRAQAFQTQPTAQVAGQQLALDQAKEQLLAAKAEQARADSLYREGALSHRDWELANSAVKQAEFLVSQQEQALVLLKEQALPPAGTEQHFAGLIKSLEAQIALLRYQISQARLLSPITGHIWQVLVEEGAVVVPGTPLIKLFQPDAYQLEVYLLPSDALQVSPGMTADVVLDGPAEKYSFKGAVKKVAAAAEERISPLGIVEQRIKTTIQLAGGLEKLRPGTALEVTFTTRREESRLVVPKTALFPHGDGEVLFVVREGLAELQPVERGLETEEETVIEGLQPGEQVIRNPRLEGLAPGRRVAVTVR